MSRRDANTTKVFVGSLPPSVTTDDLRQLFAPYGTIVECDIANKCGFLHLEDKDLAIKAIEELNNTNFMGGRISVEKGRVKPPRRARDVRPIRGGRDRGGPYSRDNGFGRGGPPPRNGMGGGGYMNRDFGYGDRYGGEYERGPMRNYDSGFGMSERRPMYPDDRRGYMDEGRGYGPRDFERRPYDDRPPYDQGGYDDRRMSSMPSNIGSNNYDRRPMGEKRPLLGQGGPRAGGGYESSSSGTEIFSRRGDGSRNTSGYGDRDASHGGGYGYSTMNESSYGGSSAAAGSGAYGNSGGGGSGGGGDGYGGFGDGRGSSAGYGGSGAGGDGGGAGYGNSAGSGGSGGYSSSSVYGDSYNSSRMGGSYASGDSMTPRGIFASGIGGGPGPRRDMPSGPGRRY